jgi:uncharacterized protein (DUF2235 family)
LHFEGNQIVFYFLGVGTRGDNFSAYTGRGLDQIVREAYVNLASNVYDDPEVYFFGYSRGAAAARVLTGMLSKVACCLRMRSNNQSCGGSGCISKFPEN